MNKNSWKGMVNLPITLAATIILSLILTFIDYYADKGALSDSRDGKKYKIVKIGTQTWMAENLNYNAEGSKCHGNKPASCEKYGRLYNWETAMKACPNGWHLPSEEEWEIISDSKTAGKDLKAANGWKESGNGIDIYGFSALPGGFGYSDGNFIIVGYYGYWWSSSSENGSDGAYYRTMGYYYEGAGYSYEGKDLLFSVRCLQD